MLNLSSSNYCKTLNINNNSFLVNFSKDYVLQEILSLQEYCKDKNILELKEMFIKSLKILLGDDCIGKIYGGDEPQAKTLQDCINYIIKEWSLLNIQGYADNLKEVNENIKKYETLCKF